MALINCSECGKQISDKASSCPNCGNPIIESAMNQAVKQNVTASSNENLLHCPKCNSTELTSNKKGFSGSKALAGTVLTGGLGLLAGTIGGQNVLITCLKCGYQYKAGDYAKEEQKFQIKREQDRTMAKKIATGEQSYEGAIILFLILSIIGIVISYKLWSNDWNFSGFIFSASTLLCIGMLVFSINTELNRTPKK